MTEISEEQLGCLIKDLDLIAQRMEKSHCTHEKEHEYLRTMIDEHIERKELMKAVKTRLLTGSMWVVMAASCSAIAIAFKSWINS